MIAARLTRLTAIPVLLALVACGGGGDGGGAAPSGAAPAAPAVSGSNSLAFGSTNVGGSSTQSVTLTNSGTAPLAISSITATASYGVGGNCVATIAPGASCGLTITFTPTSAGTIAGTVTVTSNAPAFLITLSGNAVSAASWTPGVYPASTTFAARCAVPRTGTNPSTGRPWPDVQGSSLDERNFLRSWTNELYLWYDEVVDRDPAASATTAAYFDLLKVASRDRFHFTYDTTQWIALSQSGVSADYGATFVVQQSTPPRSVVVAYVEPGSPATAASLARGASVLFVDGVDLVNANDSASVTTLNAGLFPTAAGQTHTLVVRDPGASTTRSVTLTSANVTTTPVQNVRTLSTPTGTVGYLLFNDHIATAESQLVSAFTTLRNAGVSDLVLDLRYNGGGYLDLASEVAYMIAGPTATAGKTFELTQFNRKYPTTDPVSGQAITPMDFHATTQGFSLSAGQALPTLNLSRVFVLTGSATCSASESIINGLRGVDVQVVLVGSKTCGKPYGFYPRDNCGTTYFSIQFRGVNAKNFGDYTNGFQAANATTLTGAAVPGCSVADDFSKPLGDATEARLAAALGYRANATCPTPPAGAALQARIGEAGLPVGADDTVMKPVALTNRLLRAAD